MVQIPRTNWEKLKSGALDWGLFRFRAEILNGIRSHFRDEGFLEIEAPLLTPYPTLDANIRSIAVPVQDMEGRTFALFLHSSPEHAMKKLLAAGCGNIFYLGKVFRDGELTRMHHPEFTMAEWYRTGSGYGKIQTDVEELITGLAGRLLGTLKFDSAGHPVDLTPPWDRITMRDLFIKQTGIDLADCPETASLRKAAMRIGVHSDPADDWETLFFRIFLNRIESGLGLPKPVFVTEYPARLGLMAKKKENEEMWVERSELYISGMELANGYTELTDPKEQEIRFQADRDAAAARGYHLPVDDELIRALRNGLPACSGISLGVDRLVMLLTGIQNIEDVLLFPLHQASVRRI
ncbi:EF-P lysine aminoacylase GenX [bacterium]|nr:EF-P lysine aminoacylase GenX [bacterium]